MRDEIPGSDPLEVFANEGGGITIKQDGRFDESFVTVSLGQFDEFIEHMYAARSEALECAAEKRTHGGDAQPDP